MAARPLALVDRELGPWIVRAAVSGRARHSPATLMRALTPSRRPRQAAVQRLDESPSNVVMGGGGARGRAGSEQKYLTRYQNWQAWAKRYARTIDAANFSAAVTADSAARCEINVELRTRTPEGIEWTEVTTDQRLDDLLGEYKNERQDTPELIRAHAWHYQVAGECVQSVSAPVSGAAGVDFGIYSHNVLEWDKPKRGQITVKLAPNGVVRAGTAFVIGRDQAVRFWIPDEEWQAYATSPMVAGIDALHRYASLVRWVRRTADNRLTMDGILWTPGEAHEANPLAERGPGAGVDQPQSQLDLEYREIARRRFGDDEDDDIASVVPFPMHWDHEFGPPEYVEVGRGLDQAGIDHRKEALEDYARGSNVPASAIVGGGPGDANHWTEWLVDKKYFDSAVAPVMDRITHQDLTLSFLQPALRELGYANPEDYRIGYDPAKVIVKPDQSDLAVKLYEGFLLSGEATLKACNFDLGDKMTDQERLQLIEAFQARKGASPQPIAISTGQRELPAGSNNVTPAPPTAPAGLGIVAAVGVEATAPADGSAPTAPRDPAEANRLLRKVAEIRQRLGRRLLDGAEIAMAQALKAAGSKVVGRAHARSIGAAVRKAAVDAVEAQAPLGPHLAAVGIKEAELVGQAFQVYVDQARAWMRRSQADLAKALGAAGVHVDPILASPEQIELAAVALGHNLQALARSRLVDGALAPAAGEVTGAVPASLITQAVGILEGRVGVRFQETPDTPPDFYDTRSSGVERGIVDDLVGTEAPIDWTWEWGFYGDPANPFEPHQDLGTSGFTTTNREDDEALANPNPFPETDFYAPQDHDGCTCTWIPSVGIESGPGERPVLFPS